MDRATELENRNICRICLTQEEDAEFSDIFDTPSLPMEILSIGSVEVFESDGKPRKICIVCKTILANAYKFKQICKRSDTLLNMYPRTGNVPLRIKIPQEMIPARKQPEEKLPEKPETTTVGVGSEMVTTEEISTQTDKLSDFHDIEQMEMLIGDDSFATIPIIAPPAQFSIVEEQPDVTITKTIAKAEPAPLRECVKILNKSKVASSPPKQFKKPSQVKIERVEMIKPKILNSQLHTPKYDETMLEEIQTTADGNIQIVSYNEAFEEEYLDDTEIEVKPKLEVQDKSKDGIVYTCNVCERSFTLLQQLEIHKLNHDRERNHPCDNCDKSFFTKYDLAKHVLTHTKQKDYTCIVCKKSFSRSTLLYRHEKIHTDPNIPRHQCGECDRVYLNKLDFDKHIVTHTKNRPFACRFCEKSFAFKQGLERHEVIHDQQSQPYQCQYCDMRFPSAARLQRHLSKEHAGTRPFPCSKCSKRFMLSHHLYRHMGTAHNVKGEAMSYQCPECDEVLNDRDDFFAHCHEHAACTLNCPLCKAAFGSCDDVQEHILDHMNTDMYFCDYCNLIYMTQDDLNQHFVDQHSNELCSVDEEYEVVVDENPKKRKNIKSESIATKKSKSTEYIEYDVQDIADADYQVYGEDHFIVGTEIDGPAFVEYEEVGEPFVQPEVPSKIVAKLESTKTYTRAAQSEKKPAEPAKKLPTKPVKIERVKMTSAKIAQLKKEGKIKMVNGEMVVKF